jgi:hypothetical protein
MVNRMDSHQDLNGSYPWTGRDSGEQILWRELSVQQLYDGRVEVLDYRTE